MVKLSIIVTVYNLEDYVDKCINSLLANDLSNIEIIIIDDGSSDTSLQKCNMFISDNIKVISQTNKGVSSARNLGILHSTGEWICFIDGDDTIEEFSIDKIFFDHNIDNTDMIVAKSFVFSNNHTAIERYPFIELWYNKKIDKDSVVLNGYLRGSICGVFFKSDILKRNELFFEPSIKNGEDSLFFSIFLIHSKKIYFACQKFYLVNLRSNSVSRTYSFDRVLNMKNNLLYINSFLLIKNLNKNDYYILNYNIYRTITSILNSLMYSFSIFNFVKVYKLIKFNVNFPIDAGGINLSKSKINLLNKSLFIFSISFFIKNLK